MYARENCLVLSCFCSDGIAIAGAVIKKTFKQRAIDVMRNLNSDYSDWMVIISYRVE